MRIATSVLVIIAVVIGASTPAGAESPEAEALFQQGRKLMRKKSYAAACEKFEGSERIEPRIGTELNLGDCLVKVGKRATAWASFIKAAQTAQRNHDREREAEANKRARALEAKLLYLTISVPSKIPGLVVHRNAEVVDRAMYDQPVPVDPDDYTIVAEAPDHERWQQTIIVDGKNQTVEVPRLTAVAPPPRPATPPTTDKPPVIVSPPPPAEPTSWTGSRKRAVVLGVGGALALGGGIVLALHAYSLERQSDELCPTTRCSDPDAIDLNHSARTDGLIATVGIIGGSAMVVGAVTWWIIRGPQAHEKIAIVPGLGSLTIVGRY